ncbi:MAG TPA: N-acetylmuramoyl-L-alanine amidase [Flavobacteriales bacterium]|nr:N-acetylmuramoyl-L-alanine amidase [Flavobacteriales bacterium]
MKKLFLAVALLSRSGLNAQMPFNAVYEKVPDIPRGILEAVSWNQTHMKHLTVSEPESCTGIPRAYGLMGLTLNGKAYFRENLKTVATVSGINEKDILNDPYINVYAWAKAFHKFQVEESTQRYNSSGTDWKEVASVLRRLSEIPDTGYVNSYAMDCQLYSIFTFLNDPQMAGKYNFPVYNIDLLQVFGAEKLAVLSAKKVKFETDGIKAGDVYYPSALKLRSTQYGPAIWDPAPSCNYSSRAGTPVSAITIHTIQGTYAGAISWAKNCDANVSYHYVVRSADGQVTQMVDETIKAWHVGSENPYTIGYEHEGYVTDPSWYTTALYTASAGITKDICTSGYGINPLRTYFGASSSTTVTLGSCTKIKGHQHYPYQTHTDPGIYWNWPYYYNLVNNSTTPTTYTATTGTFYDSGGPSADYTDDERKLYLIQPAGATSVSLTFTAFDLELNWDYIFIYDGNSTSAPLMGSWTGTTSPGTVTSTGGSMLVEFRSDCSTTNPGWTASYTTGTIPPPATDVTAPTTSINVASTWVSADFTASYTDADETGGSGLEKSFYQVIDYNGTDWRANASRGFYSDNFDMATIHPDWTTVTGTWNITSSALTQSDVSLNNTNIYAYLNHGLSNRYLYNWAGKIDGTGTNRRAGFHYFCDNPALTNRGNSYFVWFRLDDDKIEIYKVTSDVFSLQSTTPYNFNAGQWYDFKVMYDRITGLTQVYVDNVKAVEWTDSSPYNSGNYISFRSGNSNWAVNNLKVYRSRAAATTVLVGPSGDLRYQNSDPTTPAGRIKTLVNDFAGNLSSLVYTDMNVDTTAPGAVSAVMDGTPADVDTGTSSINATAHWSASTDAHSGIARYWYALGTSPGATDVVNWTDNGWYDSVTVTGLGLTVGQTYYFSVKAENAAGLQSVPVTSDGFTIILPTSPPVAGFYAMETIVCEGQCIEFTNTTSDATSFNWTFTGGDIVSSTLANPTVCYTTSGNYDVMLVASGPGGTDTTYQTITVTVYQTPVAGFTMTNDTAYMPGPFVGFTNTSVNADGYSWDFGDGQTSTGANPWNLYTAPGVYTVTMIAVNGPCVNDTAYATIVVMDPNTIGETPDDISISMYPNPVNAHLFVAFNGVIQNATLTVMNDIGQPVIVRSLVGSTALNTATLAKGLYMLQVRSNDAVLFRGNFVKE